MVIVDAVEPATQAVEHAVIEAVPAATVEVAALTPAGFTVTPAICVMPVPLAVAEIVFASALVELSFVANMPLALDVPLAAGLKPFPVPVALTTTFVPLTGLLN